MPAPSGIFPAAFGGSVLPPHKRWWYRATGEFRKPKHGEYYLSGAIVEAYRAPADLDSAYWIATVAEPYPIQVCAMCKANWTPAHKCGL